MSKLPWAWLFLVLAIVYPLVPGLDHVVSGFLQQPIGLQMAVLFIYGILALGLNVVVGDTGLLHLGIAAFFGIGAFITGILTVQQYPFQVGFSWSLIIATAVTTFLGVIISAPLLRLRGDYLALVTLGFGLITITILKKFESITNGTKTLNPIPPPQLPHFLNGPLDAIGIGTDWANEYRLFYFLTLFFLIVIYLLLRNLERSRLGRAWVALREDELAATCMGINSARLKLAAFAIGAGIAGFAGALYATKLTSTLDPNHYDFNRSVTVLCCLILGGLANRNGVLLGVLLVAGYDNVFAPVLDGYLQRANVNPEGKVYLSFTGWKLMIFGLVLILMMRFRSSGIIPASREGRR